MPPGKRAPVEALTGEVLAGPPLPGGPGAQTVLRYGYSLCPDRPRYDDTMARVSKRQALALDAIEVVIRHLSTLMPSPEVEELWRRAEECRQQVDAWARKPPTVQEREAVRKRVVGLHTADARLERENA